MHMAVPKRRVFLKNVSVSDSRIRKAPFLPNREIKLHDRGHEIAAPLVELVDQQGDAVVKSGKNRVEPGGYPGVNTCQKA